VKSLNDVPVLTTHYIDVKFEVMDLVRPTGRKVIGRATLARVDCHAA
jgi:hypothetical protein